jgi:hypothetical protein
MAEQVARRQIARVFAQEKRAIGIALDFEARLQRRSRVHVEAHGAGHGLLELPGCAVERFAGQVGARHDGMANAHHRAGQRKLAHDFERRATGAHHLVAARVLDAEHRDGLAAGKRFDAHVFAHDVDQRVADAVIEGGLAEVVEHARDDAAHAQAGARGAVRGATGVGLGEGVAAAARHDGGGGALDARRVIVDRAHPRQGTRELAGVVVTVVAVARDGPVDDRVELVGDVEAKRRRPRRVFQHQPTEERDDVLGLEHAPAGEQPEQHRAE